MQITRELQGKVESELARICASQQFSPKKQAQNFLRYIVQEELAGRGEKITQYGVAIDALGKLESFCPTEDPSVRMQATRLRKLLNDFYREHQEEGEVRILLPTGSYRPAFQVENTVCDFLEKEQVVGSLSTGPKIFVSAQNPDTIRDMSVRNLIHEVRSGMSLVLSRFRESRMVLADAEYVPRNFGSEMKYAWDKYRAEFVLRVEIINEGESFIVRYKLSHTLTHVVVNEFDFTLDAGYVQQDLDAMYSELVEGAISLHRGKVLGFWSQYWCSQDQMPDHYRVLVNHIQFIQQEPTKENFDVYLQACESRLERYADDALAYLHYAILCLYAYLTRFELGEPLEAIWYQMARKSLELNPWNALAHGIYALACGHRGDKDLCRIEVEAARQANPMDTACGYLMAVGLCALGMWDRSLPLLREIAGISMDHPNPVELLPCLHYFHRGEYIERLSDEKGFQALGGWPAYGDIAEGCKSRSEAHNCLHCMGKVLEKLPEAVKD